MTDKDDKPPNEDLRRARLRTPSPTSPGRPMSRQELADAVNAYVGHEHPREGPIDANYVGKLESGKHRWPGDLRREAFVAVLKASTPAELGFYIIRSSPDGPDTVVPWSPDSDAASVVLDGPGTNNVNRRGLLRAAITAGAASISPSMLWASAQESIVMSDAAAASGLSGPTLDLLRADLRRLTTDYVVTSDLPRITAEALLLRSRLAPLIDQRASRPREVRELHTIMGAVCLLLASISHDFGAAEAGMLHARSAETFADLADHRQLLGWSLCTKAMIDLWRSRPGEVVDNADRAREMGIAGDGRLRLEGLRVRALAQLGRTDEARTLMRQLEDPADTNQTPAALDELGSLFSFPESRRRYYGAVSYALLGDLAGVERSVAALGYDEKAASPNGAWPVSWALSGSYLAVARLNHRGSDGGPEAARAALAPILSLPPVQRINQLGQVLGDLDRRLRMPAYRKNSAARDLRVAIRSFRSPLPRVVMS
ncbi:hypothetical protein [Krasilnikovia sp. MM14-A1259]|uniref:hypothetical protein n=1 Tax=Krasilnikovia sp. MM14-A1259 TaxID=3373539 RepID=UPI00381FFD40